MFSRRNFVSAITKHMASKIKKSLRIFLSKTNLQGMSRDRLLPGSVLGGRHHCHKHLFTVSIYQDFSQGTSLVAQWLRICLPMQGTRVRALVREDPTCCGAAKPVPHNY